MTAADEAKGRDTTMTWTTWEELLLACAVKRHGLKDWDSVTMEIQTRTSSLCTPQICRDKYLELKRRFVDEPAAVDEVEVEVEIPWIEELRKLRVAELTQEVQRYDLSIQSLQSEVKRLEDERERSHKDNQVTDGEKPDLEMDSKTNRSENDKIDEADRTPPEVLPENSAGKEITGEHSNRSFNESNSSENREEKASAGGGGMESEPVLTGDEDVKPDPDSKVIRENSCNDSSDRVARQLVASRRSTKEAEEAADSKEGTTTTKESSDVQSSASLTKKKRRKVASRGGGGVEEEPVAVSQETTANASVKKEGVVVVKSEPLVAVMDIIRAHKHGSVFGRRLESQKSEYNKIIRQHVDLRIVQARIDDGSYSSCTNKFYLDLLLIFNNAIVFFPKSSTESIAAHALRNLVLNEIRKRPILDKKKPDPISESGPIPIRPKSELERSDSLLAKQKSAAPIVVCRKRSSISGKPSSANKVAEKETAVAKPLVIPKLPAKTSSNEEEGSMKMKEKPVTTGARSMRRSSTNTSRTINSTNAGAGTNKNPLLSTSSNLGNASSKGSDARGSPPPPPKVEKKKAEVITTPIEKKRGAADFLKRIKKASPGKGNVGENSKGSGEDGGTKKGSDQLRKKVVDERRDVVPARQRSGGGRQVKEDISPSKRGVGRPPKKGKEVVPAKRGRETVEPESKRPAKRTRR